MIKYLSDNLIRLLGPVNVQTNAAISAGTCTAALYDERKESKLIADEAIAQTVLSVDKPWLYVVGRDVVSVQLNDGTIHDGGIVTASSNAAKTITITNAISGSAANSGNRVMRKLGAGITLSAFGTPVVGTFDWGFEGVIESNHADIQPGLSVRVEILLDASGVVLLEALRSDVVVGI